MEHHSRVPSDGQRSWLTVPDGIGSVWSMRFIGSGRNVSFQFIGNVILLRIDTRCKRLLGRRRERQLGWLRFSQLRRLCANQRDVAPVGECARVATVFRGSKGTSTRLSRRSALLASSRPRKKCQLAWRMPLEGNATSHIKTNAPSYCCVSQRGEHTGTPCPLAGSDVVESAMCQSRAGQQKSCKATPTHEPRTASNQAVHWSTRIRLN